MGTNAVSQAQAKVQDGFVLLQKRKAMYESAQAQTTAVQEKFNEIQKSVTQTQNELKPLEQNIAQKIMMLSNFKVTEPPKEVKEPKDPAEVKEPKHMNEPKWSDFENDWGEGNTWSTESEAKAAYQKEIKEYAVYSNKMVAYEEYQKDLKQYKEVDKPAYEQYLKDLKEYSQYEALKADIEANAPDDVKAHLKELMAAAQAKEVELTGAKTEENQYKAEYDFSYTEYQQLQEDLKAAQFEVKLENSGDNLTKVAKNSLDNASIDGKAVDVKDVYKGIVAGDKKTTNDVGHDSNYYTHMAVGTSHKYGADDISAMGADLDLSDDFGAEMKTLLENAPTAKPKTVEDSPVEKQPDVLANKSVPAKSTVTADPNHEYKAGKNGEITLPRGMDIRVGVNNGSGEDGNGNGVKASKLQDYGISYDEQSGMYMNSKGQKFTADEVNDYFRSIDGLSQKYLDKAEEMGLDVDRIISGQSNPAKALKNAVKAQEKADKAQAKADRAQAKADAKQTKANEAQKRADAYANGIQTSTTVVASNVVTTTTGNTSQSFEGYNLSDLNDDARRYLTDAKGMTATAPDKTVGASTMTKYGELVVHYEKGELATVTLNGKNYKLEGEKLIPA